VEIWRRKNGNWEFAFRINKPGDGTTVLQMQFVNNHEVLAAINHGREDLAKPAMPKSWSKLLVMDLDTRHVLVESRTRAAMVGSMAISDDGRFVAVGDYEFVDVYDMARMAACGRVDVRGVAYTVPRVSITSDGRYLAYASASLAVRDLRSGAIVFRESADENLVRSKESLATYTDNQAVQSSPIENDIFLRADFCFLCVHFVDSGKKLIAVTESGELRVWRTADWKPLISETLTQSHLLEEIRRRSGKGGGR
jgi:WD40 repeat protein